MRGVPSRAPGRSCRPCLVFLTRAIVTRKSKRWRPGRWTCWSSGGGINRGRGRGSNAGVAGPAGRPCRVPRPWRPAPPRGRRSSSTAGLRYPLEQGDLQAGQGGAAGKRDLLVSRPGAAPGGGRCRSSTRSTGRSSSGPTSAPGWCCTTRWKASSGRSRNHRHPDPPGARLRRAPALRPDRLAGAMVYYDAQVDDGAPTRSPWPGPPSGTARHVPAPGQRRVAAPRRLAGDRRGRQGRGDRADLRRCARVGRDRVRRGVVGTWSTRPAGCGPATRCGCPRACHLVMAAVRDRPRNTGMIVRTSKSVLFFIPWGRTVDRRDHGTPTGPATGPEPAATAEDVDYILGEAKPRCWPGR